MIVLMRFLLWRLLAVIVTREIFGTNWLENVTLRYFQFRNSRVMIKEDREPSEIFWKRKLLRPGSLKAYKESLFQIRRSLF